MENPYSDIRVDCPKCPAFAGWACFSNGEPVPHPERVALAARSDLVWCPRCQAFYPPELKSEPCAARQLAAGPIRLVDELRARAENTRDPALADCFRRVADEYERIASLRMPAPGDTCTCGATVPPVPVLATFHTFDHADGTTTATCDAIPGEEARERDAHAAIGALLCRSRTGLAAVLAFHGDGDPEL